MHNCKDLNNNNLEVNMCKFIKEDKYGENIIQLMTF